MKKTLSLISLALLGATLVLFFFLRERDIPRSVLEAKYATPPSQFVQLDDGARVHYRDRGPRDAPVLLLLHGSNASLFTWEPWSKSLSDEFRVVSVDLPSHGLTGAVPSGEYSIQAMVNFTADFADKIGVGQFALAGNSMGGAVAAQFAEQHPDRVTKLVLIDPAGLTTKFGGHIALAFRLARIPILNRLFLHITPRAFVVAATNDAVAIKSIITDDMIQSLWDFARMEGSRLATQQRFAAKYDRYIAVHIKEIKTPTLILWGAKDEIISVDNAQVWAREVSGAKLIIYPEAGHIPMEELADQSAGDVRAFLKTTAHQ